MSFITIMSLAMGSAWVSGINLYAAVATLGLLGRFTSIQLPGELQVVTNWWVIAVASSLYVVEFVADKVPLVDSVWDAVHTFIRVPAGAVLAAAAFGDFDKGIQAVAFLLGGGLALSSHSTKAVTRVAINTSPEPVSNIVASLFEDAVAIGSILLSVFVPVVLFIVVAVGLVISIYMLPKIIKYLYTIARRLGGSATKGGSS